MNELSGKGIAAFNPNPSGYKVFRNVKDYGAKGMWRVPNYDSFG
jgi:glucan 1,3-beta-glucosidase